MKVVDAVIGGAYKVFPFLERYRIFRQFIKFCIVGFSNLIIDFSVYLFFTRFLDLYFIYANFISFTIAVSWSFTLNKRWTFKMRVAEKVRTQYMQFFIVNIIGIIIQTSILYYLVEKQSWFDLYAKGVAVVLAVFWNFGVSKFWIFREKKHNFEL